MSYSFSPDETAIWESSDDGPVEDPGTYPARIRRLALREAAKTGASYLKWELEVAAGRSQGRQIEFVNFFGSAAAVSFARKNLRAAGIEPPKRLDDLEALLPRALDRSVTVEIARNGRYTNYSMTAGAAGTHPPGTPPPPADDDDFDDDIPF